MKFSKKVLSLGLATAMVAGSAVSFALPNNAVVLDTNKAYDLDIFFGDLPQDVVDAIAAADGIWFDVEGAGFVDAFSGTAITQAEKDALTNISYLNADGTTDTYAAFDSETPIEEELTVESVSAVTEAGVTTVTADVLNAEEGATATVEIFANGDTAAAATNADVEIVDGKISTTFEGLPAGTHVARVTVGEVSADAEFTVEEVALAVESVSAINATNLEVKLTEAFTGTVDASKFVIHKKNYPSQTLTVASATLTDSTHVALVVADNTPALKATDYVLAYDGGTAVEFAGDSTKPTFTVEAVDSKTVKVTFSEKVDKTQAETITNYSIKPAIAATVPLTGASTAKLAEDGKTLTVSIGAGDFASGLADADYFFIINTANVADLAGNAIVANSAVTFKGNAADDVTAPTILSSTYSEASKQLTVNFSEPLSTTKLDKTKFSITDGTTTVQLSAVDVAAWSNGNTTLTLTVSATEATAIAALGANRTLSVGANGFADAATVANYNTAVTGISLAQTAILTGTTYNEETNKLALTFNKGVDVSTLDVTNIALSGTGATGVTLTVADTTVNTTADGTVVEITLKDSLANLANWEGASVTNRKVTFTTGATKDITGTAVGTASNVAVAYTEDSVKPTLVSAQFNASTQRLTLTFSEKIDYSASNFANFMITDNQGNAYALDTTKLEATTDATVYTAKAADILTGAGTLPVDGSKIYYAVNTVKDMAGNGAIAVASTSAIDVTYVDQTGPSVNATVASNTGLGLNKVKVTFSKKVDKVTAETTSNYAIALSTNSAVTLDVTSAQLDASGLFAILTVDADATVGYVYNVTVANVKDIYGNVIVADGTQNKTTWTVESSTDATGPSLIASGVTYTDVDGSKSVTAGDTLKLKYSEPVTLGEVVAGDFTLSAGSLGTNPTFAAGTYSNEVVITLGTSPTLALGTVTIDSKASNNIKDAAGNASVASGAPVTIAKPDTTAPAIASAKYQDNNADGSLNAGDYVVLTFSEAMDTAATIGALDGTNGVAFAFANASDVLGDNSVVYDWLSSTELRITLDATPDLDGAATSLTRLNPDAATINIGGTPNANIKDLWGNPAAVGTAVKITSDDTTAPTISSVAYTDNNTSGVTAGDYVDVTFSEPVHIPAGATVDANDFYISNGGTFGTGFTVAKVAGSDNTVRVTLGSAPGFTAGSTTVNMGAVTSAVDFFDASGNRAAQTPAGVTVVDNGPTAGDKVAPTLTTGTVTAGDDAVTVNVESTEAGKAYYVVLADGAAAPSVAQVIAGTDGVGGAAIDDNSASPQVLVADTVSNIASGALADATAYDVYIVIVDEAGNTTASAKIDVTTL